MLVRHDILKQIKEASLDEKYAKLKMIKRIRWIITLIKAVEIIKFLVFHIGRLKDIRMVSFQRILAVIRIQMRYKKMVRTQYGEHELPHMQTDVPPELYRKYLRAYLIPSFKFAYVAENLHADNYKKSKMYLTGMFREIKQKHKIKLKIA